MRVAIYARVSTLRQAQAQTIEQQLERLVAYVNQQGWALPEENIFRDDGFSGAALNRPGLDRLRDRVTAGEIDCVVMTAPDRLARNYVHQMLLLEQLEKYACRVEFLDRPMSQDPHDQLVLQIRGAVAEYERTLIADRMRRGRQAKYRAGILLPWSRTPYGFQVDPEAPRDPSKVTIHEAEASVVREMFAFYLQEDRSLYGLVQHLHEMGISASRGGEFWNTASVRCVLTNPAYTGRVYVGRTRSTKAHQRRSAVHPVGKTGQSSTKAPPEEWIPVATIPSIIEPQVFEQVQAKLSHNQQIASRNNTAHQYLLRALVSCGKCNLSCTARQRPPDYHYYICSGKTDVIYSHLHERCAARYIPAHQLDELVWQNLCEVLTHPEIISAALQRAQGGGWLPQELQARRENLRRGQVALQNQLDRLTEAYLSGVIPLPEYQRRRADLDRKYQGIETQEKQLIQQVNRQGELAGWVASIEDFCCRTQTGLENATFEQKRKLVELLIDRVIVTDGDIEIRYVIPTSPTSEHVRFCHLHKDHFQVETQAVFVEGAQIRGLIAHNRPFLITLGGLHVSQGQIHRTEVAIGQPNLMQEQGVPLGRHQAADFHRGLADPVDPQRAFQPDAEAPAQVAGQAEQVRVIKTPVGQQDHPAALGQDGGGFFQEMLIRCKSHRSAGMFQHPPAQWQGSASIDQGHPYNHEPVPQAAAVQRQVDPFAFPARQGRLRQLFVDRSFVDLGVVQPASKLALFAGRLHCSRSMIAPMAQVHTLFLEDAHHGPDEGHQATSIMKVNPTVQNQLQYGTIKREAVHPCPSPAAVWFRDLTLPQLVQFG